MPYSVSKWLNRRLNNIEFAARRVRLKSYPQMVYVDPTNVCNFHCLLCPSGQGKIPPPHGKMPLDLYKQVVDALAGKATQLHLYNWGEPFLHADIVEMIRIAAAYGPKIYLSTNLSILREGMADELVDSGLNVLNASIDGATQEIYEKYRKGGKLSKILANMKALAEARRRAPHSRLKIRWQYLVNRYNESEIDEARRMAEDMGVEFKLKRLRLGLDNFDDESVSDSADKDAEWLPEDESLNRYQKQGKHSVCRHLWDRTIVNFDGSINPCCQIYKPEQHFADSFDVQFRNIWNGPQYVAARRMFATGQADEEAKALVCYRCMKLGNVL